MSLEFLLFKIFQYSPQIFIFFMLLCFYQCLRCSEVEVNLIAASLFSYLYFFLTGKKAFGRIILLRSSGSPLHMGIIKM